MTAGNGGTSANELPHDVRMIVQAERPAMDPEVFQLHVAVIDTWRAMEAKKACGPGTETERKQEGE